MIPRADVEIRWDVNYNTLSAPSTDDIAYGGFATRAYAGSLVAAATWRAAVERLATECEVLARIAAASGDADEFDELAKEEEAEATLWDPEEGPVAAPDLGMFAACLALCSAGCATAASCRGHRGTHAWSSEPLILFTADPDRARIVEAVARATGCGLTSTDNGRLTLWAQSIEEVLGFATLLIERRGECDDLPLPAAVIEARREYAQDPPRMPGQSALF